MGSKPWGYAAALLLVTACQRDLDVQVAESAQGLTFTASRGGPPPCIDEVTLYASGDSLNPVWSIGAPSGAKCQSTFRYGPPPPGFMANGPTPKLAAGRKYVVTMRGAGLVGQGEFTKRF